MSDVYVAFVRDDQSYAEALAVALQGSGFTVSRSSSVVDAIGECAAIVVLWTPAAARSKLFVDAADRAFRSGKMVLARMGSDPLPQMFAGTEAHSLSRWSGDPESPDIDSIVFHVDRLVSRARLASGARPAAEGAPQSAPSPRGVVHRFPSGGAATARARPAEEPQQPQRMDAGVAARPIRWPKRPRSGARSRTAPTRAISTPISSATAVRAHSPNWRRRGSTCCRPAPRPHRINRLRTSRPRISLHISSPSPAPPLWRAAAEEEAGSR